MSDDRTPGVDVQHELLEAKPMKMFGIVVDSNTKKMISEELKKGTACGVFVDEGELSAGDTLKETLFDPSEVVAVVPLEVFRDVMLNAQQMLVVMQLVQMIPESREGVDLKEAKQMMESLLKTSLAIVQNNFVSEMASLTIAVDNAQGDKNELN